jgi:hypothetical protein
MTSEKIQQLPTHEKFFLDFGLAEPTTPTNHMLYFSIYTLGDILQIKRGYPKIQDFFAQFGGLTNGVMIVLSFIIGPFSVIKMYETLGNQMFTIEEKEKGKP